MEQESLCIVSVFLDIGRENWSAFARTIWLYYRDFYPYTKIQHEMIVFMDEKHLGTFRQLCQDAKHIKIIPINHQWMKDNIHAYQNLQKEKEIMESESFKRLVKHRLHHPECSKPEYNVIMHSKIDFLCYVINNNLSKAKYYAWSDFGYFKHYSYVPKKPLDLFKFDLQKVNLLLLNELTELDANIIYTLTNAPERISGQFFLGSKDNLLEFQQLYHKVCDVFYQMGIVDDDQHVILQCYFREPSKFKLWKQDGWCLSYIYFQQD